MSDEIQETTDLPATPAPTRRHPLKRAGCAVGLLLWTVVMITPCLLVILAAQGQLTITLGSAPEQQARIWLLSGARERGIGISWPTAHYSEDQNRVCVQTTTRFILWEGSGEDATYCACYTRATDDDTWSTARTDESCQP